LCGRRQKNCPACPILGEKKKIFQPAACPGCPAGFGSSLVKGRRAIALPWNDTISSHKYMGAGSFSFLQTNSKPRLALLHLQAWEETELAAGLDKKEA